MPHVHVVANNTNIVTEQRLQNPASKELKHSLRAWSGSEDSRTSTAPRRRRPCTGTCSSARCSPSTCAVRSERSPRRAATPGWRIRARIRVARSVTRGGDEFRRLLKNLGVEARLGLLTHGSPHLVRIGREPGTQLRARVAHARLLVGCGVTPRRRKRMQGGGAHPLRCRAWRPLGARETLGGARLAQGRPYPHNIRPHRQGRGQSRDGHLRAETRHTQGRRRRAVLSAETVEALLAHPKHKRTAQQHLGIREQAPTYASARRWKGKPEMIVKTYY